VTGTDGIEVLGFDLGPGFPNGAFVAQDHQNSAEGRSADRRAGGNQNFKLVPWEAIAGASSDKRLIVDNTVDPRKP
jgi:3-phytase